MKKPRRAAEQPRVKAPTSEVVLWRPSIVLASRIEAPARRKPVTLAAPTAHPDAGEPRIVGSIFSLADAGATLAACAAASRPRWPRIDWKSRSIRHSRAPIVVSRRSWKSGG